jgi:hypothetical protein
MERTLLILPGNHPSNRAWCEAYAVALQSDFKCAHFVAYSHWEHPDRAIDFSVECHNLHEVLTAKGQPSVVLAKSAGIALAVLAWQAGILLPSLSIFCGTPLNIDEEDGASLGDLLIRTDFKCIFVQQTSDPVCSYDLLSKQLHRLRPSGWIIHELPGDDHGYNKIPELVKIIRTELQQNCFFK